MHHPFASFANVNTISRAPRRHRPGSPLSPNQSAISRATQLGGPARPGRTPRRASTTWVAWACAAFSDPAASLEVLSPSALSGRAALFEAAGLERSRFGVSRHLPALADLDDRRVRPCGFTLERKISGRCSHDGCASRVLLAEFISRRLHGRDESTQDARASTSSTGVASAIGVSESRARRRSNRASASAEFPPSAFGSCAVAFPGAAFRYPTRADNRGLAGTNGPSLVSPGGAPGVQPFAGSFPPTVGGSSLSCCPHVPFHRAVRPD